MLAGVDSVAPGRRLLLRLVRAGAACGLFALTACPGFGADCVSLPAGWIGWWPGDGNGNDIAGTNHAILLGGAVADVAGLVGQTFSFDGTNGYVRIPDAPELRPTNLTVEAWVRFADLNSLASGGSPAGQQYLVFRQNTRSSVFEGFSLTKARFTNPTRDLFVFGVSSAGGTAIEARSSTTVSVGTWYHVAGVRGSNYIQIYVNGQLQEQSAVNFPQDYGNYPVFLGSSGNASWDHKLKGLLDEVTLYSRALSSNEIAAIYAAGAAGKCKTPEAVTIGVQPQSQSAVVGGNVILSVTASGTPPLIYQWQREGTNLLNAGNVSGATSAVLSLSNVQTNDSGDYRVVVSNVVGAVTSQVAVLLVDAALAAPTITNEPSGQVVEAGATALFSVGASGAGPLGYQWRFNGVNLANGGPFSGATSPALSISPVLPNHAGGYSVVVTNAGGAVTSAVAVLTVSPPTNCIATPPGLVGWWPGDGSAADIAGTNHGSLLGGAAATEPGVVGTAFKFDGTNNYVSIPDSPQLRPPNLSVECWVLFTSLNSFGNTPLPGQQYMVFKNNSRNCSSFEAFVLSKDRVASGDVFLWEVTSSGGNLIRTDSKTKVATNVWYHVVGVAGSNYLQMYVNGVMETNITFNFPLDYGVGKPLVFGSSGESCYDRKLHGLLDEVALYNRPLTSNEIAALYLAGGAGRCKSVRIVSPPQSQTAVPGANVTFTVTAAGVTPLDYQWQFDGNSLANATNASLTLSNVAPSAAGDYAVVVSNRFGAITSAVATLSFPLSPTDIVLSPTGVPENQPAGTVVGNLTAVDPSPEDTHTFSLVAGTGDTDNFSFSISGSSLLTASTFNYETKNTYTIRVRATDSTELSTERALAIAISDANDPPTANLAVYNRAADLSWKVRIADLLAEFTSDEDNDPRSLDAVRPGTNSAAIWQEGDYIFYLPSDTDPFRNTTDHFNYEISDGRGGAATNAIRLTVGDAEPGAAGANIIAVDTVGGHKLIKFRGIPYYAYRVQRTEALNGASTVWTNLGVATEIPAGSGYFELTDPSPPGTAFYRTIWP